MVRLCAILDKVLRPRPSAVTSADNVGHAESSIGTVPVVEIFSSLAMCGSAIRSEVWRRCNTGRQP